MKDNCKFTVCLLLVFVGLTVCACGLLEQEKKYEWTSSNHDDLYTEISVKLDEFFLGSFILNKNKADYKTVYNGSRL